MSVMKNNVRNNIKMLYDDCMLHKTALIIYSLHKIIAARIAFKFNVKHQSQ